LAGRVRAGLRVAALFLMTVALSNASVAKM
jgi:hypothetical protein